jgi:D-alanyl-D-alanine carboxypeptidase (penicillin-binding protein 5/6)
MPPQPPKDPRGFQIQNENDLLTRYPGAIGGKTGYTTLARHTFVGAAERNGRRLVVTLLGGEVRPLRPWQQAAALLDWGFALPAGASVGHLVAPGEAERVLHPPKAGVGVGGVVQAAAARMTATWSAIALVAFGLVVLALPLLALRQARARRTRAAVRPGRSRRR